MVNMLLTARFGIRNAKGMAGNELYRVPRVLGDQAPDGFGSSSGGKSLAQDEARTLGSQLLGRIGANGRKQLGFVSEGLSSGLWGG